MNALALLSKACTDFDDSFRGHLVAMQTIALISYSKEIAPLLVTTINMSKGFDPEFKGENFIENLFEEIEHQKNTNYQAMRKNCLLGVCAAFEVFIKTVATALSYDPNWRLSRGTNTCSLLQDTNFDFQERFDKIDGDWRASKKDFLIKKLDWVNDEAVEVIEDIFWIRNQAAHNGFYANKVKEIKLINISFKKYDSINFGKNELSVILIELRKMANEIIAETPYLENF